MGRLPRCHGGQGCHGPSVKLRRIFVDQIITVGTLKLLLPWSSAQADGDRAHLSLSSHHDLHINTPTGNHRTNKCQSNGRF